MSNSQIQKNTSSKTWTEIRVENETFTEETVTIPTSHEESLEESYSINICCCRCLKNDEVSKAKRDLFGISLDWFVDAGVGTLHLVRGNWIAGILTYLIVIVAGMMITFTNFSPAESRNNLGIVKKEIWKMNKFYGILMYIPSFFPICSAKLRLFYAKLLKACTDPEEKIKMQKQMAIFKDQALWDVCSESFYESIPQAVLQIVLLLLPNKKFSTVLDYLPIGSVFFALYGITVAPIMVMDVRHKDVQMGHTQRLTAYASNALRVFSCALFISSILTFLKSDRWGTDVLWTLLSALVIFFLLDGPQLIKYELGKAYPTWSECHLIFIEALTFLVVLASFFLWVISQILPTRMITIRATIVIACYSILIFFTCAGILLYRQKLELYHSISASVYLNFYLGVKSWIFKLCSKNDNKGEVSSTSNDMCNGIPL